MKQKGHLANTGQMINLYKILVGTHTRNRQLGRTRLKWENELLERASKKQDLDWIQMAQEKVK
jgi:hypothetical protein